MLGNLNQHKPLSSTPKKTLKLAFKGSNLNEDNLIKSKADKLQISITTRTEVSKQTQLSILDTISAAKEIFEKIPKVVIIKELYSKRGFPVKGKFNIFKPHIIQLSPNENIEGTCIHEIAHLNDFIFAQQRLPLIGKPYTGLSNITSRLLLIMNKNLVTSELGQRAMKNRTEFIAETARVLICEKKKWEAIHPRIEKLYRIFLGPKIRIP